MAREAKNEPKELTVEQKLKALYQLQTTLSKIDEEILRLRAENEYLKKLRAVVQARKDRQPKKK